MYSKTPVLPKFLHPRQLSFGALVPFSAVDAQDLCAQFGTTALTRPTINNGDSNNFGTGLSNEVLEISGTFTVSSAFKFERCTLRMAPGALINVTTTAKFELRDCQIFCCAKMWQGIKMPNQGWLEFWGNTIEDAFVGLDITNPTVCRIHNNHFNSNDISVRIQDFSKVCSFGIAGNIFNENWQNMNEKSLITPSFSQSYARFVINNCTSQVPIGISGYPLNVIHGHTCVGIITDGSRVCVQRTQIQWNGLGSLATSPYTFNAQLKAAIRAENSTIKCYNSLFSNIQYNSVQIRNTNNHQFVIANNRFNTSVAFATQQVISAEKGTSGTCNITGNTIDLGNSTFTRGIWVQDVNNSQSLTQVEGNTITAFQGNFAGGPFGIEFLSGNYYVRGNHLFTTSNNLATGIRFTSTINSPGQENRIQNNDIGTQFQQFKSGIDVVSTPNAFVCGNTISFGPHGHSAQPTLYEHPGRG